MNSQRSASVFLKRRCTHNMIKVAVGQQDIIYIFNTYSVYLLSHGVVELSGVYYSRATGTFVLQNIAVGKEIAYNICAYSHIIAPFRVGLVFITMI